MTIIQLEYLLAVANCGSFSLAAEHCFVTQPSLSMQVKALEEELGVVLLDRSKKPVIPTEAGEVVLEQARETIKAERSTGAEVILKLDKDHEKGNKFATITLHMPGEDLVACHQSKAFEESVDEAIDALKRQLDKFKAKFEK